jgi:hypothetical protein
LERGQVHQRTEGNPQHGDVAQSQEELLHYITSLPTYNITCGMYTVVISISQETTTGATNEKNKTGSIIVCAAAGRRLFFFLDIYNAKKRKKKTPGRTCIGIVLFPSIGIVTAFIRFYFSKFFVYDVKLNLGFVFVNCTGIGFFAFSSHENISTHELFNEYTITQAFICKYMYEIWCLFFFHLTNILTFTAQHFDNFLSQKCFSLIVYTNELK